MEKHQPITTLKDPHPVTTLKKTFFFNVIPSKVEEEQCKKANMGYRVTKTLMEIRDVYPQPIYNAANPWRIRRTLASGEVAIGKIFVSHDEAFDYVFRYWNLEFCNFAVMGQRLRVVFWDFTEGSSPVSHSSDNCIFEKGCDEGYYLGIVDLVKSRSLNPGDEIGLYLDARTYAFVFKVLCRGSSQASLAVASSAN